VTADAGVALALAWRRVTGRCDCTCDCMLSTDREREALMLSSLSVMAAFIRDARSARRVSASLEAAEADS
jgi:hypothetical protein